MSDFKDKVVFISGSSQGIGKAVAMELGLQGAKLVLNGRDEEKLETCRRRIESCSVVEVAYDPRRRFILQRMQAYDG